MTSEKTTTKGEKVNCGQCNWCSYCSKNYPELGVTRDTVRVCSGFEPIQVQSKFEELLKMYNETAELANQLNDKAAQIKEQVRELLIHHGTKIDSGYKLSAQVEGHSAPQTASYTSYKTGGDAWAYGKGWEELVAAVRQVAPEHIHKMVNYGPSIREELTKFILEQNDPRFLYDDVKIADMLNLVAQNALRAEQVEAALTPEKTVWSLSVRDNYKACAKCGEKVSAKSKFCAKCGAQV